MQVKLLPGAASCSLMSGGSLPDILECKNVPKTIGTFSFSTACLLMHSITVAYVPNFPLERGTQLQSYE